MGYQYGDEPSFQELLGKGFNFINNSSRKHDGYFKKLNNTPQRKNLNGSKVQNKENNAPTSSGLTPAQIQQKAAQTAKRIERLKAESDAVVLAGKNDINSVFYKAPTRDQSAPNGGTGSGTQTSPGGNGKPIIMKMTAANTLYQSRGLGSYRSGNKGFINDYNLDPQDSSKYFNPKFTGDFIPKSVAGNMKGYMDDISPTAFSPSTNGQIEGLSIKDSFNNPTKLNTAGMSMSEALADTESMRGPETDEGRLMRARAAFLNAEGSMQGLRAQERELDIIYAGGKHYVANDNGGFETNPDGTNAAADAEQIKQLKSGAITPQLFKEGFKADLINRHASKPSQGESPYAQSPVPVSFNTEPLADFGSTDILGNNMDMIAGNAFDKTDISPLSDSAFNTDLDVSQYVTGYKREPLMRPLK